MVLLNIGNAGRHFVMKGSADQIRRQQRKEEKGEGTSSKGPTSTDVSPVEVKPLEPRRKITPQSVAEAQIKTLSQRNAHVLQEICIICGRDAS